METFACANCQRTFTEAKVKPLAEVWHLWERLTPGDEVPIGECPKCGAFVYPIPAKGNPERVLEGEVFTTDVYAIGTKKDGDLANVERAQGCSEADFQRILNIIHKAIMGVDLDAVSKEPVS